MLPKHKYITEVLEDDAAIWEAFGADALEDDEENMATIGLRLALENDSLQPLEMFLWRAQRHILYIAGVREHRDKGGPFESSRLFLRSSDSEIGNIMRDLGFLDYGVGKQAE